VQNDDSRAGDIAVKKKAVNSLTKQASIIECKENLSTIWFFGNIRHYCHTQARFPLSCIAPIAIDPVYQTRSKKGEKRCNVLYYLVF